MPTIDTENAASVWCDGCSRAFYVTDEPTHCPYCGGIDVAPGYPVAVRPE